MRFKAFTLLCATCVLLAACHRSDMAPANETGLEPANDVTVTNDASASAATAPPAAQGFVNAAASSDRFEIESSKLVEASGKSAATKAFAANMIKAHTASTEKLKRTVSGISGLTINDALNADQQGLMNGLRGKTGADLDSAYAAAQVKAHEATLSALKAYDASGDNPSLKTFANGLTPTVTAHLNMAKGLK